MASMTSIVNPEPEVIAMSRDVMEYGLMHWPVVAEYERLVELKK